MCNTVYVYGNLCVSQIFLNPDFDFTVCCKYLAIQLFILFIGKETYSYLQDGSKIKGK